jgi:hypothetical protein
MASCAFGTRHLEKPASCPCTPQPRGAPRLSRCAPALGRDRRSRVSLTAQSPHCLEHGERHVPPRASAREDHTDATGLGLASMTYGTHLPHGHWNGAQHSVKRSRDTLSLSRRTWATPISPIPIGISKPRPSYCEIFRLPPRRSWPRRCHDTCRSSDNPLSSRAHADRAWL